METNWKVRYQQVYNSSSILDTKIDIHAAYSIVPTDIFSTIVNVIHAPNNLAVLDVGCGTGEFLLHLRGLSHHGRLVGVDITPNVFAEAKAKSDIQFVVGDIEAFDFADTSFDAVTAIHMLSHVQNLDRAFSEVQRVLIKGGLFIATGNSLYSYPHVAEYRRRIFQTFGWGEPRFSTTYFNLENMKGILSRYWNDVHLITLIGKLQIPLQHFLAYFNANIDVWEKTPTADQRDIICRLVAEWSTQDEEKGYIVEPKKVGIAICLQQ